MKTRLPISEGGYSFVETLISLMMISFCVMGISQMSIVNMKSNRLNLYRSKAIVMAQNQIERLKNSGYTDLKEGTFYRTGEKGVVNLEWIIEKNKIFSNTALINMKAIWKIGKKESTVELSTLVGK